MKKLLILSLVSLVPSYLSGIDQTFENSAKSEYTWERENQLFNENDTSASIEESNKIESSKVAESSTTSAEQIDTNDEVLKKQKILLKMKSTTVSLILQT